MYNKVFLIGNLTRDPEMRYTPSGIAVTRYTLAVNRLGKKKDDGSENPADFIRVVAWRRLAEISGEFLRKGISVYVEGRLQLDTYEKNGEKRTSAEVVADNMQILTRRGERSESGIAAAEDALTEPTES